MTASSLLLHQLRFDLLTTRRNRRAQFFIVALPLVLLVTFAGLFGTDAVEVAGHDVPGNRASVPGIMGLAILTSSFVALTMTVSGQRQAGILKRRRGTPVPGWVLVVSRVLTSTAASAVACTVLVVVAKTAYGIQPPPGFWPAAALAVIVGSVCWACVGFAVTAIVTSPEQSGPLVQVVMLPLQLISGIYFAASQLPDWLHTVASLFPLIHLVNALQYAFLPGGAQIAWRDLGVLALWAVAAGVLAARTFRWLPTR